MNRSWLSPTKFTFLLFIAGMVAAGCKRVANESGETHNNKAAKIFTDVTEQAGVAREHFAPILDHQLDNIMAWVCSVGAAAAASDFNNDGWIDLYVTNSRKGKPNYLYRNNADGTFTDVGQTAGVAAVNGDDGVSTDCAWGDFDNDGWADLYLVRWGRDSLFRNNGNGTFSDVSGKLFHRRDGQLGIDWANGDAAIFFDYDLDGRLDIYVGNYFDEHDLWHLDTTRIMHDDFEKARNGGRNFLYHQRTDGTFEEAATALGVDDPGWTLAVGSADMNNDGWPDLYCADDFGPDQIFVNRGGVFDNVSPEAIGVDTKKGMNVDFGDYNGDGWFDIYVSNITTAEYLQEGNMLWHNNGVDSAGRPMFADVSLETGSFNGGWGWGAKFFDYDNDADLDLVAANGFISAGEGDYWYDLASWTVTGEDAGDAKNWPTIGDRSFSGYESTRLFQNDHGAFTERAAALGLDSHRDGRGVVAFDYDNDGDLDLFVANQGGKPHLYRNAGDASNHWLIVRLEAAAGTRINRDAVGARVTIVTASGTQVRERDGGNSYCGQSDPRIHFGLGGDSSVELLEVRWPDGGLQYRENVPAGKILSFRQDPAQYAQRVAIQVDPPDTVARSQATANPKLVVDSAEIEKHLKGLEDRLRQGVTGYAMASTYRARCVSYDRHDRAIKFFESMVQAKPDDPRWRIELACAYVDKIPTCGGIAAIVSKGSLAKKSLDQLDRVISQHADSWPAYYCRGMNHLHWPRALRHSDDAVVDLRRAIELQHANPADPNVGADDRSYVALGDAHCKAKQYDLAKKAWLEGLAKFPDSVDLLERLVLKSGGEQLGFVEDRRSLEQPIDTSLSFLDRTR